MKYESKTEYYAVEVSKKAREVVDRVNRQTKIPKRHIVEMALTEPERFRTFLNSGATA